MTGEKTEENKEKFYFIPIGIFTKSFCGFHWPHKTVRWHSHFCFAKVITIVAIFLFVREETLRIANTDRTSMHPEENGVVKISEDRWRLWTAKYAPRRKRGGRRPFCVAKCFDQWTAKYAPRRKRGGRRPFCVAKCFDLLTAQDGAVAKGNFRLRKSWPWCGGRRPLCEAKFWIWCVCVSNFRLRQSWPTTSSLTLPLFRTRLSYKKPLTFAGMLLGLSAVL